MAYTTDADGGEKNWLQRLGDKIPGFSGYQAKERRRDIDKLHRETLADRIRAVKSPVASAVRDLTDSGRLLEVAPLERVSKKVDTIENRIRFATYGYSGFFDVVQIKEDQLDRLYHFDLALVEKVEAAEQAAAALASATGATGDLKAAVGALEKAVDDLGAAFDTRQQAINGFGGADSAPGRPLFH
jgi:hypothetical protein